jgi:nicotinamidase-related amidase
VNALPPDAVLLVIDVQKGMDVYAARYHRNTPELEANIARLEDAWRDSGRPIIHVQHISKEPQSPLRPGQPGVEIKDEVRPRANATASFDNTGPDGKTYGAQLLHDVALADLHGEFATVVDTRTILSRLAEERT